MSLPEHLADKIQRWLADYVADADPRLADHRSLARYLQALPLYADLGGCIAIRPDGELILVDTNQDWSRPVEWTREIEPKWRTIALASGSWTYPELRALLPSKGVEDVDCPDCAGTGRLADSIADSICDSCLGVGWRGR